MSNDSAGAQSLEDREAFIKKELLPKISKMQRYLGAVDYNTEFYRRKRQGQSSWEFEDRDTKTTFEACIIGEVADAEHGTLLRGKGNFKPPKSDPEQPITDKSNVKNVVVLRKLAGSTVKAEKAFLNQTVPLNNISEEVLKEDQRMGQKPSNFRQGSWVETTAAADADSSPQDLIVISLGKKFDAPKARSGTSGSSRVIRRVSLSDDEDESVDATKKGKMKESAAGNDVKVVVGAYYEPDKLPDYDSKLFSLVKNKLVQYDIRDIDGCLIPAWEIEEGLRPGTVILVSASLHVYNIDNSSVPGFRRYFQINAERIKVLAKPLPEEPVSIAEEFPARKMEIYDDFALFSPKKRKENNAQDEHFAKKNKVEKGDDDYVMCEAK